MAEQHRVSENVNGGEQDYSGHPVNLRKTFKSGERKFMAHKKTIMPCLALL